MKYTMICVAITLFALSAFAEGGPQGRRMRPRMEGMQGMGEGGPMNPEGEEKEGPCRDKARAKHSAHEGLHECVKQWMMYNHPKAPLPSEDCASRLSAFVAASKDAVACREAQAKK